MHRTSPTTPARVTSQGGRRAGVAARTRLDFWFDAAILAGYTVAYSYGFTGVVIHEWLGIGLGVALLLHLTLHWDSGGPHDQEAGRPAWPVGVVVLIGLVWDRLRPSLPGQGPGGRMTVVLGHVVKGLPPRPGAGRGRQASLRR